MYALLFWSMIWESITPTEALPRHIMHEQRGLQPVTKVCDRLKGSLTAQEVWLTVCKNILKCHQTKSLKPGTIWRLLQRLDVYGNQKRLKHLYRHVNVTQRPPRSGRSPLSHRPNIFWMQCKLYGIFGHRIT